MSDRRDQKGRILREGESQRKDGQYMYRYTDLNGERRTIYSWTLVKTDKPPKGKRSKESLRDLESQIRRDLEDGIVQSDMTVSQAFQEWMESRPYLNITTQANYRMLFKHLIEPALGSKQLVSLRHSMIEKFYLSLAIEKKYAASTIIKIHSIINQVCDRAVQDNILRANPATNAYRRLSSSNVTKPPRERRALDTAQQNALVNYVYNNTTTRCYGNLITVLLGTGMRIGEALGLRTCDCDFDNNIISVNHALLYKQPTEEKYKYMVAKPKTSAGNRTIPMLSEVREALLREIAAHPKSQRTQFEVDGYKDFIFLNSRGNGLRASHIYTVLQRIREDYNCEERAAAATEHREPVLLPPLSPHILRHTFCTRLCEQGEDIKVIQNVMGHRNSATTLDVYADATEERKTANFRDLEGKLKLA